MYVSIYIYIYIYIYCYSTRSSNLKPFGPKSGSKGFCLCRTSISGRMAADEGDCVAQVVNAFSDENLCVLDLPNSSTVLDIKRHVQASHRISIFCQCLLVSPAGYQVGGLGRPSKPSTSIHQAGVALMTMRMAFAVSCVQLAGVRPLKWSAC